MARTPQRLSDDQQQLVRLIEDAAQQRRDADEAYRAAVLRARQQGVTLTAIARAAGIRTETARVYIERHQEPTA